MQMTESEIKRRFREAKNPQAQIRILADLNDCSVDDIKAILNPEEAKARKRNADVELMIEALSEEMDRVDKEIRRLELRYKNIKGAIDALDKLVV
jgi:DNA-binding transcriptional MerR regulator